MVCLLTPNPAFQKRQLDQVIKHLEDEKSANIQYILVPISANFADSAVANQSTLWPPGDPANPGATWVACLQYPASRGSIHITSSGKLCHTFPPQRRH